MIRSLDFQHRCGADLAGSCRACRGLPAEVTGDEGNPRETKPFVSRTSAAPLRAPSMGLRVDSVQLRAKDRSAWAALKAGRRYQDRESTIPVVAPTTPRSNNALTCR